MVVHVFRELRRKQLKLNRGKGSGSASVSLAQLKKSFASLSNYEITSRLRDRCECQPLPVSNRFPTCFHSLQQNWQASFGTSRPWLQRR